MRTFIKTVSILNIIFSIPAFLILSWLFLASVFLIYLCMYLWLRCSGVDLEFLLFSIASMSIFIIELAIVVWLIAMYIISFKQITDIKSQQVEFQIRTGPGKPCRVLSG